LILLTILITYITGPRFRHRDIRINRLVSPRAPSEQKAFGLPQLLTEWGNIKLPVGDSAINEVIKFTTSVVALKPRDTQKLVHAFLKNSFQQFKSQANSGLDLSPDTKNAINSFANELSKHDFSPVGGALVRRICEKVSTLLQYPLTPMSRRSLGAAICEIIQLLAEDVDLYVMLTLDAFVGLRIVHCKVSLATFFILSPSAFEGWYDHIIEKLKVGA